MPQDNLTANQNWAQMQQLNTGTNFQRQMLEASKFGDELESWFKKSGKHITDSYRFAIALQKEISKLEDASTLKRERALKDENAYLKLSVQERRKLLDSEIEKIEKELEVAKEISELAAADADAKKKSLDEERKLEKEKQKLEEKRRANEKAEERERKLRTAKEKLDSYNKAKDNYKRAKFIFGKDSEEVKKAKDDLGQEAVGVTILKFTKAIANATNTITKIADSAFAEAESILNNYQAIVNTRLEGSGREFGTLSGNIRRNLAFSTIVEQKEVLKHLDEAVRQGIAYDLEQRAFLKTVSENIKSTFDAFDANLLRIIRLQREDSTFARMGLETSLNRLFNTNFLDSSYLSEMYDQVAGALIDASSLMTAANAAEFEYTVQKWLGAMFSVGASSNLISSIASGLNMLGTGNVQGLAGSPMQTLFAMSANRAGLDYANLLSGGLNSYNTDRLLKAMVEYLGEIANNTDNRVVAGAYGNIYNMTMSDLRSIRNLSNDINSLYGDNITYDQMAGVTENRLSTLDRNYTLGKQVTTLFENLKFSSAADLVNDPTLYLLYKGAGLLDSLSTLVPTVGVLGSFINLGGSIGGLIKSGMFGISMIGNIIGGLRRLKDPQAISYSKWMNEGAMRGSEYKLQLRDATSMSYSANAAGDDIEYQTLSSAGQDAKDNAKTISGQSDDEAAIELADLYYGLFADRGRGGHLQALNNTATELFNLITSQADQEAKAQRVVITGWNMAGNEGFELPIKYGSTGQTQIFDSTKNTNMTINNAIEVLMQFIGQTLTSDGAFNVNLYSSDVDSETFIRGSRRGTTGEDYNDIPSGSGFGKVPSVINTLN